MLVVFINFSIKYLFLTTTILSLYLLDY